MKHPVALNHHVRILQQVLRVDRPEEPLAGAQHDGYDVRPTPFALLVNVASVGLPHDGQAFAAYTVLTASSDGWAVEQRRVPYDPAEERAAAEHAVLPQWVPD